MADAETSVRAIADELDDGADDLLRRMDIGEECMALAGDPGEDPETCASDAISDILSAVYGPEGWHDETGRYTPNGDARDKAQELLDRALMSWEGDAEDYTKESS